MSPLPQLSFTSVHDLLFQWQGRPVSVQVTQHDPRDDDAGSAGMTVIGLLGGVEQNRRFISLEVGDAHIWLPAIARYQFMPAEGEPPLSATLFVDLPGEADHSPALMLFTMPEDPNEWRAFVNAGFS